MLYGSVSAEDIAAALGEEGIGVRPQQIVLDRPLRHLDSLSIDVKLADDLQSTVKVWIVRDKVEGDQFEFSKHAVDQTVVRGILVEEVREAFADAEVIEEYPDDKYGPSCLILGRTINGRPLHIQCSYPSRPIVKIVTVYEPDPARWLNFRQRMPR